MTQKSKLVLMAIVIFAFSGVLTGQSKLDGWSVSPKIGAYLGIKKTDPMDGFLFGIEGNIMKKQFLYSVNYYYGEEWTILSGPDRYFNQATFLFGRYNTFKFIRLDYQVGVASIWGTQHSEYHSTGFLEGYYDTKEYHTVGFVAKVGAEFVLAKFYSMGSHVQFNLNNETPRIEFVLSFSFGKLKE